MNGSQINGSPVYHEKQQKQLCLLHALNNLFQQKVFTKCDLDEICLSLDERKWFNRHRSMCGFGNYDVNVLMMAIARQGLSLTWFDNRLKFENINDDRVVGYIFNKPSENILNYFFGGRHWFAVRKTDNGKYLNFDSNFSHPVVIDDFAEFVNNHISQNNQLFLVTQKEDNDCCLKRF